MSWLPGPIFLTPWGVTENRRWEGGLKKTSFKKIVRWSQGFWGLGGERKGRRM